MIDLLRCVCVVTIVDVVITQAVIASIDIDIRVLVFFLTICMLMDGDDIAMNHACAHGHDLGGDRSRLTSLNNYSVNVHECMNSNI
jgi:hypothetical protein